jgi:hypothetical protein
MAVTTLSSGEVVVPMSSILDALEGVLSEAERQALFTQLINLSPAGVAPGDLITAELFNDMMSDINELTVRVAALEGVGAEPQGPIIFRVEPAVVTVGSDMTVIGENLTQRYLTDIDVGDTRVNPALLKLGSSPTRMIFAAPGVTGATPAGIPVQIRVANDSGEATAAFVIRSGVAASLAANPGFTLTGVSPVGEMAMNTNYDFAFDLAITSSHAETFTITPLLSVTPAAGWTATVTSGAQVSVPVTGGTPVTRPVVVRVRTGAGGTGTLALSIQGNAFTNFSRDSQTFPLGVTQTPTPTSGPIQFQSPSVAGSQTQKTIRNGNIEILQSLISDATASASAKTIRLTVPLTIAETGQYNVTVAKSPTNANWTVTQTSGTALTQATASGLVASITATISADAANAANAELVVTVAKQGGTPTATLRLGLRAVAAF